MSEWKTEYSVYKAEHDAAIAVLFADREWMGDMRRLNPGLDVGLSLEKACRFWGSEEGWEHKKRKRAKEIRWRRTYENALTIRCNQVWLPRNYDAPQATTTGRQPNYMQRTFRVERAEVVS